jgi:hypothetical protein
MVENGDTRIYCERTPEQVRDLFYAGARLTPIQAIIPQSTLVGATFCKTYRVERNGYSIGIILTELP